VLDEALKISEFFITSCAGPAVTGVTELLDNLLEMKFGRVFQKLFASIALISMVIKHFLPTMDAWN
jgi:hypothetical protein